MISRKTGCGLSSLIQNLVSHLSQEAGGQQDFRNLFFFLFFSSAIIAYQMLLHQFLALCISPPVNIGHLWLSPQPFAPVSPFLTLQGGTSLRCRSTMLTGTWTDLG